MHATITKVIVGGFDCTVLQRNLKEWHIPWVPEAFFAYGGNFRCWPKADTWSFRAGHYKDLTETGHRARKISGTQSKWHTDISSYVCECKGWQQKWVRQLQSLQTVYWSYPILPFGIFLAHFLEIDLCHAAAILSQDIKKLCFCTASLAIRARLAMQKQSFFNLLGQNGGRMTKVYSCICTGGKPHTFDFSASISSL